MDRTQRDGILYTMTAVIGYSFVPIFAKNILESGLSALDLATWRFVFAVPLIWALIYLRRSPAVASEVLPRNRLMVMGSLMTAAALTAFWGLERIPASTYIVLFYTYPAMVAVASIFLGERLTMQSWLALALTGLGVILTAPEFLSGFSEGDALGFGLAILNAAVVAVYFLWNARVLRGYRDISRASAWTITGALIPVLIIAVIRGGIEQPADLGVWRNLLGLTAIGTVLSIFALTSGLNRLGAARTAILSTVEPPLTIVLAVLLLSESMSPLQIAGSALIVISVVMLNARARIRWPGLLRARSAVGD